MTQLNSGLPGTMRPQLRMALVMGPLMAITPLSIDFYLPAFPDIASSLGTTEAGVQMSLVVYMLAMGAGPLLVGPISDRIGRRTPLLLGFLLYTLASIACALAPSIEILSLCRFLQGLGGSVSMVCCRASVRDRYTGYEAARLLSMMMLVLGVAPILAPSIGSMVITVLPWRALFWILAAIGVLGFLLVFLALEETLEPERRVATGLGTSWRSYWRLSQDARFVTVVLTGSFAQAGFFSYLVGSSFVFIEHYGLTPADFGLLFACNAAALILGAQLNVLLLPRFGPFAIVKVAVLLYVAAALMLFLLTLLGQDSVEAFAIALFACIACLGFINANTTALALDAQGKNAGTAAAAMGLAQTGLGVLAGLLVSLLSFGNSLTLAGVLALCAIAASSFCWFGARRFQQG